jgi:hypothetical protein
MVGQCIIVGGERDRHAPHHAAGEVHGLYDRLVVLAHHEAREGREDAGGDHLEVRERPRAEGDLARLLCPPGALVFRSASYLLLPATQHDYYFHSVEMRTPTAYVGRGLRPGSALRLARRSRDPQYSLPGKHRHQRRSPEGVCSA